MAAAYGNDTWDINERQKSTGFMDDYTGSYNDNNDSSFMSSLKNRMLYWPFWLTIYFGFTWYFIMSTYQNEYFALFVSAVVIIFCAIISFILVLLCDIDSLCLKINGGLIILFGFAYIASMAYYFDEVISQESLDQYALIISVSLMPGLTSVLIGFDMVFNICIDNKGTRIRSICIILMIYSGFSIWGYYKTLNTQTFVDRLLPISFMGMATFALSTFLFSIFNERTSAKTGGIILSIICLVSIVATIIKPLYKFLGGLSVEFYFSGFHSGPLLALGLSIGLILE
mmetsp:Transcript_7364/g.9146  ORF Transcript_7364/g.9146 Transcript_7364/m.9146 type:complete len:285 (+) Transcript_7364:78-932(+)